MSTLAVAGLKQVFDQAKQILTDQPIGPICMENHEEVISRLKFLGHVQKDEKIDVHRVNRQPNTFITKIYRSIIYPDNRGKALKFIRDIIARTFELLEYYGRHKAGIVMCKSLVQDLIKARQGIMNLKYTYSDDTKFCCDMDVIIENIASRITSLQTDRPDIFEEEKESGSPVPSPSVSRTRTSSIASNQSGSGLDSPGISPILTFVRTDSDN